MPSTGGRPHLVSGSAQINVDPNKLEAPILSVIGNDAKSHSVSLTAAILEASDEWQTTNPI